MEITIIENRSDSDPDWLRMRLALWPQGSESEHRLEMKELIHDNRFLCLIARDAASGAVAFAEVFVRPYANGCETRPVPFLEGIWVAPEAQAKGIGSELVEHIEVWCRSRGFTELGSDTEVNNIVSRDAHASWGFEETERVIYFRKRL